MISSLFKRAWKGEASLAAAFWIIHVLIGAVVLQSIVSWLVNHFMPGVALPANATAAEINAANMKQGFIMLAICFPYTLYSSICVWRCAKNSWGLWNFLAKLLVVLSVIGGLMSIYFLIVGMPTLPAEIVQSPPAVEQPAA